MPESPCGLYLHKKTPPAMLRSHHLPQPVHLQPFHHPVSRYNRCSHIPPAPTRHKMYFPEPDFRLSHFQICFLPEIPLPILPPLVPAAAVPLHFPVPPGVPQDRSVVIPHLPSHM